MTEAEEQNLRAHAKMRQEAKKAMTTTELLQEAIRHLCVLSRKEGASAECVREAESEMWKAERAVYDRWLVRGQAMQKLSRCKEKHQEQLSWRDKYRSEIKKTTKEIDELIAKLNDPT